MFRIRLLLYLLFIVAQVNAQSNLSPRKMSNGKYGYVDQSSSPIIQPSFDKAFSFENDLAKVILNGKWGIIDVDGDVVAKPKFSYIGWADDPYYIRNRKNLELTNNPIPSGTVFFASDEGIYAYMIDEKWGLLNKGKTLKAAWDGIHHGEGGHFAAFDADLGWTWIDRNGKSADVYFKAVRPLKNGFLACRIDSLLGMCLFNPEARRIGNNCFEDIRSLNEEFMKARINKKWGVIDKNGEWVSEPEHEEIKYNKWNNALQYLPFSEWQVSDPDFKMQSALEFEILYRIDSTFFAVTKGEGKFIWQSNADRFHPIDVQDSVASYGPFLRIFNASHEGFGIYLKPWSEVYEGKAIEIQSLTGTDYCILRDALSKNLVLMDYRKGKTILQNFSSARPLEKKEGFLLIEREMDQGIYDVEKAEWIIEPLYSQILPVNDSAILAAGGDSVFHFDYRGTKRFSAEAEAICKVNDSTIGLLHGRGWQICNLEFKSLHETYFEALGTAENKYLPVKSDGGWGIINLQSRNYPLSTKYDSIGDARNGYRIVWYEGKKGIINENGYFTYPLNTFYEHIDPFDQAWTRAVHNDLAGLIDQNGTLKVSSQYEDFAPIIYEHIPFKFRSKWGLLDLKERIVMQPLNDSISILKNDVVQVWKNGKTGIRDFSDREMIAVEYDSVYRNAYGSYIVQKDGKYGFYNQDPRRVRPPGYETIIQFGENIIGVRKSGSWQLIDSQGKSLSDKRYADLYFNSQRKVFYLREKKSWIIESLD